MQVELSKEEWDDIADLIDAGFELLDKEDGAYLEVLTRTWSSLRHQLEAQGYNWDSSTRDRGA